MCATGQLDPKGILGNTLVDTLLLPTAELSERNTTKKWCEEEKKESWFKARGWF